VAAGFLKKKSNSDINARASLKKDATTSRL